MNIIIVGCGKVGYAIAQQLTQEKHDITVVDDEAAHLNRADSTLDVLCIHGNGASISVLMEAGARDADLVIAVTGVDETNLVCALIAKSVGAQHTIARVRNPEYRRDADMLKREIGLDMVINPDLAAAQEIARRAGVSGMVAGQSIDLLSEHREPNEATLQYIHTHKTADLLTAPLLAAAYIAGADEKAISALETFGLCVGLAFQIDDDLLDVLGDAKDLGKQTGMDAQRGKMTWPSLVGVEAAQKKSRELGTRAEEALSVFGDSAWFLRAFAEALAKRKK